MTTFLFEAYEVVKPLWLDRKMSHELSIRLDVA